MSEARDDLAWDVIEARREPLDWIIECCAVCGCQLGPGIGSRTRTGRCIYESHRSTGGIIVRVQPRPLAEQPERMTQGRWAYLPSEVKP